MALESIIRVELPWFFPVLRVLNPPLILAPGVAMLFAWDYARSNRARCVRLARIAMVGAALSVLCCLALVVTERAWRIRGGMTLTNSALLALLQALVFTMAWLATRGPRSSRPITD